MKSSIQIFVALIAALATFSQSAIATSHRVKTQGSIDSYRLSGNGSSFPSKIKLQPGEKVDCIESDTRSYTTQHVAENVAKRMASYRKGKPFCNQKDTSNRYNQKVVCPSFVNTALSAVMQYTR
jgi:hypothetical protein